MEMEQTEIKSKRVGQICLLVLGIITAVHSYDIELEVPEPIMQSYLAQHKDKTAAQVQETTNILLYFTSRGERCQYWSYNPETKKATIRFAEKPDITLLTAPLDNLRRLEEGWVHYTEMHTYYNASQNPGKSYQPKLTLLCNAKYLQGQPQTFKVYEMMVYKSYE